MSARKWMYKLKSLLSKWFRPPLEVSIANHSLKWMLEEGKRIQSDLYQAQYRPYLQHPHCFRHGDAPVPLREVQPGRFECPYREQHGSQPLQPEPQSNPYDLRPLELERIKQENLKREEQPGAKLYQHLKDAHREPSKNLTARLYPEQPSAWRKPPHLEWLPDTQEMQAQSWLNGRDEMRRHGSVE